MKKQIFIIFTLAMGICLFAYGQTCPDGEYITEILPDLTIVCGNPCPCPPVCGDGNVDPGEQCDDGNTIPGDGCDENCQVESAGDIDGVCWVGLALRWAPGWSNCPAAGGSDMDFEIIFYEDSGGPAPGPVIGAPYQFPNGTCSQTPTGETYVGFPAYEWCCAVGQPITNPLAQEHISIQSIASPAGCSLLWGWSPDEGALYNGRQNGGDVGTSFAFTLLNMGNDIYFLRHYTPSESWGFQTSATNLGYLCDDDYDFDTSTGNQKKARASKNTSIVFEPDAALVTETMAVERER